MHIFFRHSIKETQKFFEIGQHYFHLKQSGSQISKYEDVTTNVVKTHLFEARNKKLADAAKYIINNIDIIDTEKSDQTHVLQLTNKIRALEIIETELNSCSNLVKHAKFLQLRARFSSELEEMVKTLIEERYGASNGDN